jgi:hypothetical protein
MTVWISLGISAGAFVVSVAAVVLAYRQLAQAKIANALPVVLGLLDDFSDTRAERHFIIHDLSSFEASKGVWGLPGAEREKVLRVLHYLDHLGLLVDQKLANEKAIGGFIGDAIISLWQSKKRGVGSPLFDAANRPRRPRRLSRLVRSRQVRLRPQLGRQFAGHLPGHRAPRWQQSQRCRTIG